MESQIAGLDNIYKKHFFNRVGFFCEVGANDGRSFSNTYELANKGWKGLYIEPVEAYANNCREAHKDNNIAVFQCACSNHIGKLTLYEGDNIFSANESIVKGKPLTVPCYTLDSLLYEAPDLLVIDVEFHEKEVLEGFSLERWSPKMVIIEAHENHENEKFRLNSDFINQYFKAYTKIYSDSINNVYVR